MLSSHVSFLIAAGTILNILLCVWLLWWTARRPGGEQPSSDLAKEKTGHVWDGDLEEYNNPLPRWWLGLFIVTVIFGAGYLLVFPGLGNFSGIGNWSSVGTYEQQMAQQRARFDARLSALQDKSPLELARDPQAMAIAKNLFGANCAGCHGSDARGAKGFPNLTDGDWLWGGDEATVYQTIANGRMGVMPAWQSVLGAAGVDEVATYVVSLGGRQERADKVAAGKERFAALCSGCHGSDARGNPALGAPNLTDYTWLYGGDLESVRASIAFGRNNQMPAHVPLLGETKVRLLTAYVLQWSQPEVTANNAQDAVLQNAK